MATGSNKKNMDSALLNQMAVRVDELAQANKTLKTMEYFYNFTKMMYTWRADEIAKKKDSGTKVIGSFCNFAPEELIIASNAIPVRHSTGFQDTILPAEELLPRNFCPLIKSALGFTISGNPLYELSDVIVIPTTCDGKKKFGEILAEDKSTWLIEVPHTTETPQARALWLEEIKLFKDNLENLTGNKITIASLRKAIELSNRKRSLIRRLYEVRKRKSPPIWGRDALLVTSTSNFDDPQRWASKLEELCKELEAKEDGVCPESAPRILLTGSPVFMPTWKIPEIIEESGGIIVTDDICTGSKGFWDPIEVPNWTMEEMLLALADRYLMNTCACFTPNNARLTRLQGFARDFNVQGVFYHILQACHIYGVEARRIEKALKADSIPMLTIETDYSQEDVEQIRIRVEAFLEMIITRRKAGPS
jgi:benzoyl-CoA reductase/2-hydroxyglutaryl-CoA dehydratase subunit BcrC/BadD/HgdB